MRIDKLKKGSYANTRRTLLENIGNMDVAPLSYTEKDVLEDVFKAHFDIIYSEGVKIRVKDAVNLLRNNLVNVSAIKAYLSKTFKVVNIHGILYYKNLVDLEFYF